MKKGMVLPVFISLAALSVWGCKSKEPEITEGTATVGIAIDPEGKEQKESQDKGEGREKGQKEKQEKTEKQNGAKKEDEAGQQKAEQEMEKAGTAEEETSFSFADLNNV